MKKYLIYILVVLACKLGYSQGNPADISPLLSQLAQSKPDTHRISICIKLAGCYLAPGRAINRIDSVAFYLNKAKELNAVFGVTVLRNQINLFSALRDYIFSSSEDPNTIFMPVIDSCKKTDDKFNEAQAWRYLGNRIGEDPPNYAFKLTCFQNGLGLAREIGDDYTEWILQVSIAHVHTLQENFNQAERELSQVLQLKNLQPVVLMHAYDRLTFLYLSKGQLNKALEYALKTQQMMGITGDSTSADKFYHRLVWLYRSLDKDKERVFWEKKQLEFALATNDIPGVYNNIEVLTGLMRELGKSHEALDFLNLKLAQKKPVGINDKRKVQQSLGGIYSDEKKYDRAEECYLEMIRLGRLQKYKFAVWDRAFNNFIVGRFYFNRGSYHKARPFLEASAKDYEAYSVLPYRRRNHLLLFKTDSALGNYTEAIRHLTEANRIGDSIFHKERNMQIEELQIAYETKQKDENIRLLGEKEKLAKSKLNHTQSTRNWIIAAACMLLIVAALQFRQARIRKKNNSTINIMNKQLLLLVTEKDWLVKEIHHRIKNNLQMVVSLLNAQTEFLTHPSAIDAMRESRERMEAIAIIHQKLYQLDNSALINMTSYVNDLVDNIKNSFSNNERIQIKVDVTDVSLDIAQSLPLGLILNEAITNAIKYAFAENEKGLIQISLKHFERDKLQLKIADNGKGLPAGMDINHSNSLGMKLIRMFSEQLDGNLYFANNNGLEIGLNFETTVYQDSSNYKIMA